MYYSCKSMLDLVLEFFGGFLVAGMMKDFYKLSLTFFLAYASKNNNILIWYNKWKSYYLCKIRFNLLLLFFDDCIVGGLPKN